MDTIQEGIQTLYRRDDRHNKEGVHTYERENGHYRRGDKQYTGMTATLQGGWTLYRKDGHCVIEKRGGMDTIIVKRGD